LLVEIAGEEITQADIVVDDEDAGRGGLVRHGGD